MKLTKTLSALRREEGSTLAAVLMVMLVLGAIGTASIQVAQHANDATSVDRERLQTVEAAEAGVNDSIRRIETGVGCDGTPTAFSDLYDGSRLVGRYRAQIQPEAGEPTCTSLARVIHAWGYSPTGGTRAMRHLAVDVKLVPQEGFPFTIFAEGGTGTVYVKNNGTVQGDVYAENLDQTQNNITADNVVSPGSIITKNNATYSGTLWAGGNINVGANSSIGKSVIASGSASGTQGTIYLQNNSVVAGDAVAKSTVTLENGSAVQGSISQNNPNTPQPPVLSKPTFNYDQSNYDPPPASGQSASQVTSALNAAKNNLQGTYRANDSGGTVVLPDTLTVTGPLTIIAAGKVDLGRTMLVSGGPHQVVIIAESDDADAIDVVKSLTVASGIEMLLWTNGGVDMKNGMSFAGAIYANSIDAKNAFTISHGSTLMTNPPAGFDFTNSSASNYNVVPTLWREVKPGTPPA
ncbi:MAG: hypothetical protein WD646_02945 [Actinomycetota bacterium]